MRVTTTTLEMRQPPLRAPRALPSDVRLDRAPGLSPEYARFLYGLVGGPWHWTERLAWSRRQWLDELGREGEEHWILYRAGAPAGYVQLHPTREGDGLDEGTTATAPGGSAEADCSAGPRLLIAMPAMVATPTAVTVAAAVAGRLAIARSRTRPIATPTPAAAPTAAPPPR